MRIVADTNIVVSGLLWSGPPRQVLAAAFRGETEVACSNMLLIELDDAPHRPRFAPRPATLGLTAQEAILQFMSVAELVVPPVIDPVITQDPDDDAVLACAIAAEADVIVSGDSHLLGVGEYRGIPILTASAFLARLENEMEL